MGGNTAFVDSLARALAEVAGDEVLRGRMAAAGRERAAAYSWDSAAERLWTAARGVRAG
jgi:glycosyltransferase involved in cell wall biosynthesis